MPLSGYLKNPLTNKFLLFFAIVCASSLVWSLSHPTISTAAFGCYNAPGGGCVRHVGAGIFQNCEPKEVYCGGGQGGACAQFVAPVGSPMNDYCAEARVPGGQGAETCNGTPDIAYHYGNGGSQPPTHVDINFRTQSGANCNNTTWSAGGSKTASPGSTADDGLNIYVWDWTQSKWSGVSRDPNNNRIKIWNGNGGVRIPIGSHPRLADLPMNKEFLIYPNCLGNSGGPSQNEIIEKGCYRDGTLSRIIVDDNRPFCSISTNLVGSNVHINISATDSPGQDSGIARLGIHYRPKNGSTTAIIPDNLIINPPQNSYYHTDSSINVNSLNTNTRYEAVVNVWDAKGNTDYPNPSLRFGNNWYQCVADFPCIMPQVQVNPAACTPSVSIDPTLRHNTPVGTAVNLNSGGNYCQVDYIDITPLPSPTTQPTYNLFESQGYANAATTQSSRTIANGFYWANTPYVMSSGTGTTDGQGRYYAIRYYDQQTNQHSYGTFRTPPVCAAPSPNPPVITYAPQCTAAAGVDIGEYYELRRLRWSRPSGSLGDGFQGYQVQASPNSNFSNIVYDVAAGDEYVGIGFWFTNLNAGTTYYYRVRAYSLGGYGPWSTPRSEFLRTRPTAPQSLTATAQNGVTPTLNVSWNYTNAAAPVSGTSAWTGTRTGGAGTVNINRSPTPTSFTQNVAQAYCNNTNYIYTIRGNNVCGSGPDATRSVNCPANQPPSCGAIQYSENNGSTWTNWPTGSGGLSRNKSQQVRVRRVCTDPEGNTITYNWGSAGCGSFSSTSAASPNYTFPNVDGASCDLTSTVRDSFNNSAPNAAVVAKTTSLGNHSLSIGPSIERSNTSDSVIRNSATVTYNFSNYVNPATSGSSTNRATTIAIDTTTTSFSSGTLNICHPNYGTCRFSNNTSTVSGITTSSGSYPITVTFTPTYMANVKQVFQGTSTDPIYNMRANFTATDGAGNSLSTSRTANPGIINKTPTCSGLSFSPPSPFGTGDTQIAINLTARDDWGLRGVSVGYRAASSTGAFTNVYSNGNYFTGNPRSANTSSNPINWNVSSLTANRYQVQVQLTDLDGQTFNCLAGSSTGTENPGGGSNYPEVFVDKTAPTCSSTGAMTVLPNADGSRLGFTVSGSDPGTSNTASGLDRVAIVWRYGTTGAWNTHLTFTGIPTPKPTSYNYSLANTAANAFNMEVANRPSGVYQFAAIWYDRADNASNPNAATTACRVSYEKGSRISGKVNLFTGTNGTDKRDYRNEVGGTGFVVRSRATSGGANTTTNWVSNNTNCTATFPGTAGASDCNAYFVSSSTYMSTATPVIELVFPKLSTATNVGKYRCSMDLYNTTTATWTTVRSVANTNANGNGLLCDSTSCYCRFSLAAGELRTGSVTYSSTSIWPTHVEFNVSYNSDQVHGQVRNENGGLLGGSVTVGSSTVNITSPSAGYAAPAGDNTANYPRTNTSNTVRYNNSDLTKLCVWASRNNFTTNATRTSAFNSFDTAGEVGALARSLSLSGWTVGASAQCSPNVALANGPLSPKLQNQTNFMVLPKVRLTGTIYYLKDDNLCSDPSQWAANTSSSSAIPVTLSFATQNPGGGTFHNPANPTASNGSATYNTGQIYNVYANMLPGSSWNSWQIQTNATFTDSEKFTVCGSGLTSVNGELGTSYPSTDSTIEVPIGVYMNESNDWWQTYNGGVHALNSLTNNIPVTVAAGEAACGYNIHSVVGDPTCSSFYGSGLSSVRSLYRGYYSGGIVTTLDGTFDRITGKNTRNWRIIPNVLWRNENMKPMRIPFAAGSTNSAEEVVNKVRPLTGSESWNGNLSTINASDNTKKVFLSGGGTKTINSDMSFGNNNYLLVEGNLDINANLLAQGAASDMRQSIFIVVTGNVTIRGNVSEINAHIYTPGTITVRSLNGPDAPGEIPLRVYGGLYAGQNVDIQRDLENIEANWGLPAVQIMYNPALIMNSRKNPDFPTQLKESNVYWTQD